MILKCLIVDDEPLAIELISSFVNKMPELTITATCNNALKAIEILEREEIDLMFLDIQMPQLTGFELLRKLEKRPATIITTAYRDYAFEGYEFDVVDFLLKPIFFDRFSIAVNKVLERKGVHKEQKAETNPENTFENAYMYFKVDREMVKVFLNDILWIESMKDYVKIKTITLGQLVTYQRISYLEEKLPEPHFIRIHRSFIVNRHHITAFSTAGITVSNKTLPIGRLYKNQVIRELQKDIKN